MNLVSGPPSSSRFEAGQAVDDRAVGVKRTKKIIYYILEWRTAEPTRPGDRLFGKCRPGP